MKRILIVGLLTMIVQCQFQLDPRWQQQGSEADQRRFRQRPDAYNQGRRYRNTNINEQTERDRYIAQQDRNELLRIKERKKERSVEAIRQKRRIAEIKRRRAKITRDRRIQAKITRDRRNKAKTVRDKRIMDKNRKQGVIIQKKKTKEVTQNEEKKIKSIMGKAQSLRNKIDKTNYIMKGNQLLEIKKQVDKQIQPNEKFIQKIIGLDFVKLRKEYKIILTEDNQNKIVFKPQCIYFNHKLKTYMFLANFSRSKRFVSPEIQKVQSLITNKSVLQLARSEEMNPIYGIKSAEIVSSGGYRVKIDRPECMGNEKSRQYLVVDIMNSRQNARERKRGRRYRQIN